MVSNTIPTRRSACRREIQGDCDCLSDSVRRDKYNEFDPKASAPEGRYIDPEGVFGAIFGGERFVPIIGTISLAKDMKSALQEAEDGEGADENIGQPVEGRLILSPEEKERKDEKGRIKAEKERQKAAEVGLISMLVSFFHA